MKVWKAALDKSSDLVPSPGVLATLWDPLPGATLFTLTKQADLLHMFKETANLGWDSNGAPHDAMPLTHDVCSRTVGCSEAGTKSG